MQARLAPIGVSISGEGVAVVGDCRQRLGAGDELASGRAMRRAGERHLYAELVRPMRPASAMHSTSGASTDQRDASRARSQVEAFVAKRGLNIIGTYAENESGAKLAQLFCRRRETRG
jgi:hypothetical protein